MTRLGAAARVPDRSFGEGADEQLTPGAFIFKGTLNAAVSTCDVLFGPTTSSTGPRNAQAHGARSRSPTKRSERDSPAVDASLLSVDEVVEL